MRLIQIDYFLTVAETLSFTSAAHILYISQPALSKQIALLEEELGVKLFQRSSRKVELTDAGKQFEEDLKNIRVQLEQAKRNVMQMGSAQNIFKIACFDGAVVNDFLPVACELIRQSMPGMEISLFRGAFQENNRALEESEADLLFTLDSGDAIRHNSNCTVRRIVRRQAALIYSEKFSVAATEDPAPEDFNGEPFLVLAKKQNPYLYQRGIGNLQKLGIRPSVIEEQSNFVTLMTNLDMGKGFALLSSEAVNETSGLRGMKLDETYGIDIVAVWRKDHPKAGKLDEIFENFLMPPDSGC